MAKAGTCFATEFHGTPGSMGSPALTRGLLACQWGRSLLLVELRLNASVTLRPSGRSLGTG